MWARPHRLSGGLDTSREAGHRAFKQKTGCGDDVDRRNLRGLRLSMKEDERLFVDANPNPLCTRVVEPATGIFEGRLHMIDAPGIGIESPIDDLSGFVTLHESFTR